MDLFEALFLSDLKTGVQAMKSGAAPSNRFSSQNNAMHVL